MKDITKATLNTDPRMERVCKSGFLEYRALMRAGHKARRKGMYVIGREHHWMAGNVLELTVAWMLGMRARHNSENAWKWGGDEGEDPTGWDFINESSGQRVDIKACKASQYGNRIFVERETKGFPSGWTKEKREGDFLLYVDTETAIGFLIGTKFLQGACERVGHPSRGGDDNSALGWTIKIEELANLGLIWASWTFPKWEEEGKCKEEGYTDDE